MKVSEMKRLLRKDGCKKIREGGNHEEWKSPITGKTFQVSRHNGQELATGTEKKIRKQAGL